METAANPAFDVVLIIGEPHLFSVQQLNIETVHTVLRDCSLQSSIFENESKFNLQMQNKHESAQILGNDVTSRIKIMQFSIKLRMRYCWCSFFYWGEGRRKGSDLYHAAGVLI